MPDIVPIRWYFDFISPFAYLQFVRLQSELNRHPDLEIQPVPVLFAGLLKHHGHKGPAEIPSKRVLTYRYCQWFAGKNDIPFQVPHSHPFNPLPFLRAAIARARLSALSMPADSAIDALAPLFEHIWVNSAEDQGFHRMEALTKINGFEDIESMCAQPEIKQALIDNTEQALALGVFGVPTLAVQGELFWGLDMTEMALEFARHPESFDIDEFERLGALPVAQTRS